MQSRVAEGLVRALNALAVVTDGVTVTGHEVYGLFLVHLRDVLLIRDELYPLHHVAVEADFPDEAAERIGNVLVHLLRVAGEPVELRARILYLAEVAAESQRIELRAVAHCTVELCHDRCCGVPAEDERRALVTRAAENYAVIFIRVLYEIGAREEAAHAVPEEHVGKLRVLLGHDVVQLVHIIHDAPPAVFLGKEALLLRHAYALAVAKVVVARDDIAVIRQKLHEWPVAFNVLGDAVGYLHYSARLAVRHALERVDACSAGA